VPGINAFAIDMYAKLADDPKAKGKNVFFSPFSIHTALGMTYAGARGETATRMRGALRFGVPDRNLHDETGALVEGLNEAGREGAFRLSVANALWARKGEKLLDSFLALNEKSYKAGLERLDFRGDPEGSRKTINTWVEKKTEDKIKDLLPKGIINRETSLILTNAVYFKADWLRPFGKETTHDRPFKPGGGQEIKVPIMYQRASFGYLESGDMQVLEMPYKGERMSMVVFLPRADDGLPALEKTLDADTLATNMEKLRVMEVEAYLPRFRFESAFKLKDHLSALGMAVAFQARVADFSGINGVPPPVDGCMYIQEALHKAFVAVDEKGTEAAAATAVIMGTTESIPPPAPQFVADHAFLFLVRDKTSGAIVFMGRVLNPKA
jgi:serpin B